MAHSTTLLFRDDAYLPEAEAKVLAINDRRGIILDRTVFYATGGGQPGDSGALARSSGGVAIATTVYGEDKGEIVHVPAEGAPLPEPGETVTAVIDWQRRHRHMRIHTGLHLLSVVLPYPVTGSASCRRRCWQAMATVRTRSPRSASGLIGTGR